MIVQRKVIDGVLKADLPIELIGKVGSRKISDTEAEIIFTPEQKEAYTLSRFQFEAELSERGLHDTVMGMLEQLAQDNKKIEIWLRTGTTVFRWSEKFISLAEGLKDNGVDIDLDDFFEKAKQHSL